MAKRKVRKSASERVLARRELALHLKLIDKRLKSYLDQVKNLKALVRTFLDAEQDGFARAVCENFLADDISWGVQISEAIKTSSRRVLETKEALVESLTAELTTIQDQERQVKSDLKRFLGELRESVDSAESALAEAEKQIRVAEEKLTQLTSEWEFEENLLAKRDNFLLRNTDKTKALRISLSKKQTQRENLAKKIQKLTELRESLIATARESQAAAELGEDHPEFVLLRTRHDELSQKKKDISNAKSEATRDLAKSAERYGVSVIDELELETTDALRALEHTVKPLSRCAPDIPKHADVLVKTKHIQDWAATAIATLESPFNTDLGDDQPSKQHALVGLLTKTRIRRIAAEEKKTEKRKKEAERREKEAREKEKARQRERERLERQVAADERRKIRDAERRAKSASQDLREFDSKNRRIDDRLERLNHRRISCESRIERVLNQLSARGYQRDAVVRMRSRFPAYDNALAAREDVDIEHTRLKGLVQHREKLVKRVNAAERNLKAVTKAQSQSPVRGRANISRREINTWEDAEKLAEDYMRALGFTDARRTGSGSDGGVDVESRRAVAQVKDQSSGVGRGVLQQLFGVAQAEGKIPYFFARHYSTQAVEWGLKNRVKMYQFDLRGNVKEVSR
jgi:hypothetical protein